MFRPHLWSVLVVVLLISCASLVQAATEVAAGRWIAPVAALAARLKQGDITILDARGQAAYRRGHIPSAIRISWRDYRNGYFRTGKLPEDLHTLARDLGALGVDTHREVVVYGAARDGWGEEGRIAWMLHYLGHRRVSVLDGGWRAWVQMGGKVSQQREQPVPGIFHANPVAGARASEDQVARARTAGLPVLDVRATSEWRGATPYFEARGGHIPGAVHLEWTEFLRPDGTFDRSQRVWSLLHRRGLAANKPVIVYCTGGVRSAMVFVALKALGFQRVRNYDGSWYEWSADKQRPVVATP